MQPSTGFRPFWPGATKGAAAAALTLWALFSGGVAAAQPQSGDGPAFSSRSPLPAELQRALDEHNRFRAKHCAPPLKWSAKLQADAQAQANACLFSHNSAELVRLQEGENLYWGSGALGAAESAVGSWYDEIKNYDFTAPVYVGSPPSRANGHFTQVVWAGSTQLGCAHSNIDACVNQGVRFTLWVCRYGPPGNINVDTSVVSAAQSRESLKANVLELCR